MTQVPRLLKKPNRFKEFIGRMFIHAIKGRPKEGSKPSQVGVQLKATIVRHEQAIEIAHRAQGRFILATSQQNKIALSDRDMLMEYKA